MDRRLEVAEVNARGGLPCRMLESFQVKVIGSSNKFLYTIYVTAWVFQAMRFKVHALWFKDVLGLTVLAWGACCYEA